jgi:ribosome biogenesis GTPase
MNEISSRSSWDADREREFLKIAADMHIANPKSAHVIGENGQEFQLRVNESEIEAIGILKGALRFQAESVLDLPVAGDWVIVSQLTESEFLIHKVLPRRSLLVRKIKGEHQKPDPICANMDQIFILQGLDGDFQPRRLERTLVQIWESQATPVIILTKKDLYLSREEELAEKIQLVNQACPGVKVFCISNENMDGIEDLKEYWNNGSTSAFIGSSGVGKSSLLNHLLGDKLRTVNEVRVSDSKGKHTTTNRWMFRLESGGWILDTPGMREVQLWSDGNGLEETFPEIYEAAHDCKFQDCTHQAEPECGVKKAIELGKISQERWLSFFKLKKEIERSESIATPKAKIANAEKAKWKIIHKEQKRFQQQRNRERYK